MEKEVVATQTAPAAIGPYSQAIRCGNLLFLSGQIALEPATAQLIEGGTAEQTRRVLQNIEQVLTAAGGTLQNVVKTTVFLQRLDDFAEMNQVYATFFVDRPPARSAVEVSSLPRGALVEIEAVAILD
ncbi:MAG: RidA family protein [Chloroflexota bacterium]|nr:MAG: RidA family protein [Chloroflexota bacterium]